MCEVEGCINLVVSNGLCDKHRKQVARHGTVGTTRPLRWGQKEKHKLYNSWSSLKRKAGLSGEWLDFWKFVSDVEDSKLENSKLCKLNSNLPYSKGNFYWKQIKMTLKDYDSKAAYQRAYMKANPDRQKIQDLKRSYGITLSQYREMEQSQNFVCAICGNPETSFDSKQQKVRSLSVDHCHNTGKVRGLLCSHCNHAIGKFKDDVSLLEKAIKYLKEYPHSAA